MEEHFIIKETFIIKDIGCCPECEHKNGEGTEIPNHPTLAECINCGHLCDTI